MGVKWVKYGELSNIQEKVVKRRYKPPYTGWLYRTSKGQLTYRGGDRRKMR